MFLSIRTVPLYNLPMGTKYTINASQFIGSYVYGAAYVSSYRVPARASGKTSST